MVEKIKHSLRIGHDSINSDIQEHIEACKLDLQRVGVKKIEDTDIVIIQDAARPFLKDKYIEESLKILNDNCDGAIIGVKCKDTVKIIDKNGIVVETPNRDNLIMVHTPQTFKFEILKKAHQIAEEKNILATDDASLVEMISGKIKVIYGDYDNIKITVQEDLKFLK